MPDGLIIVFVVFAVVLGGLAIFTKPYWTQERLDDHNKGN